MRFVRWATVHIKKQLLILDWRQFLAEVNKAAFKVVFLNDIDAYQNLPTIALTLEVSLLRLNTLIDHSSFNKFMVNEEWSMFLVMWMQIYWLQSLVYRYSFSSMFLSFLLIYDML